MGVARRTTRVGHNRAAAFPEHAEVLAAMCDALGDETFDATWAEGRAMTTDEAVGYALSEANEERTGETECYPFCGSAQSPSALSGMV